MVTQIPISVKMDAVVLEQLDLEVSVSGVKRNRIINDAVRVYINLLDAKREAKVLRDMRPIMDFEDAFLST